MAVTGRSAAGSMGSWSQILPVRRRLGRAGPAPAPAAPPVVRRGTDTDRSVTVDLSRLSGHGRAPIDGPSYPWPLQPRLPRHRGGRR